MVSKVKVRSSIGRLGVRLWMPFIVGALVSLVVVAIIALVSAGSQRSQAAALQREVAQRVAGQLDLYVRQVQDDITSLAEALPLIAPSEEAQRLLLKSTISKLDSPIYQLSVVGLDGAERLKVVQHQPNPSNLKDLSGDTAFEAARVGGIYFGPVYNSEFGVPFLDTAVPIHDEMGHVLSVLRAEIDLSSMWSLVNTARIGEQGYAYVVDANGKLLAFHDVPRLVANPSVADLAQVSEAVQAVSALPAARPYPSGLEGVPVLAYYLPVDLVYGAASSVLAHWIVIVEQPISDAYAQADIFGSVGLGLSLAALAAILVMGFYISRRVARPIESLRKGAAALGGGDLNYRIQVDTGDELEFLAQEFNQMSATLQQSQSRLAAMARERERQAEDAQLRLREMSALIQSSRAITSLDLEDVLGRLAREVARAVQGDRCSIYVLDARQRRLALRGEWDSASATRARPGDGAPSNGTVTFEWGEGIIGWVAREGKPIFLANAQADKRFVAKAPNDRDVTALMSVPLSIDDSIVGVLQASTRPGTPAFDPSDQKLLSTFANQAAAVIKNSYLYETERRRAQEMSIIAEIIRTISSSLDLDATLSSILASIRRLIAYDLAEITLWDAHGEVLRTRGHGADPRYDEYSRTRGGVYHLDEGYTGWIARHRSPLLVPDVETGEVTAAIDRSKFPIRSHVGVPLMSAQQLIGTLELASYTPNAFNETHLDTLRTIAAQAAVAIQNAQLYLESRQRAEELAGLFRVASLAASAQEPGEILRQIMAEAAKLMGAQLGVVLLHNADSHRLEAHPTALFGAPYDTVIDLKIDEQTPGFDRSVFRTGYTFRSDNALADNRILEAYRPFVERFHVCALVSAPLVMRDQQIGEVHIARTAGTAFTQDDEQRLLTLATLLGGAIETARLASERGERLNELAGLYEISQAVSSITDLQQVYSHITRSIAERLRVEFVGVLLYDPDRDALVSQPPFYGVPDEVLKYYFIRVDTGSRAYRLWTEQDVWISNDVPNDPLTQAAGLQTLAQSVGVKRTLFAAMKVGTRRIGVIQVSNKLSGEPFDDQDARLMSIYATQVGVVVENARLYASTDVRLQQRIEELTALSAISQELNATLDLDHILELVLDEAVRATGATHGWMTLVHTGTRELDPRAMRGYTPEEIERVRMMTLMIGDGVIGKVIETGDPMRVDDVHANADYVEVHAGTQSELAAPIRYALEVVGAINLESPQPAHFTPDHLSFVQALAAQAAIAIGSAQRYDDQLQRGELLRRRAEQLAHLFEIGQALRSDRPLVELLDDVVHAVRETADFGVVVLSLLTGDPPVLQREAGAGLPVAVFEELKKVRQPWDVVSRVLLDVFRISQSYYIPMEHRAVAGDLQTWPPMKSEVAPRASGRWHEEDMLITPLRATGGRVLGILSVDQPLDGRVPTRATIESLELFANQAAIAIENARLLEDLQQRIDSLTLFNVVSRSISARLDLDGLLGTIVQASGELTNCQSATIFLRDATSGQFVPRSTFGFRLQDIAHLQWAEGEGLVGAVARDGRALIVPDVHAEPRFTPDPTDTLVASMLLMPIAVGGQVIGVLSADKSTPRSFSDMDMMLLSTLADQAAIAIENAQLFEQTVARTRELSTLFEATTAITSDLSLDRVLDTVGRQLIRALSAQTVTLTRWDRARNQAVVMADRDTSGGRQSDPPGTVYDLSTYPGAVQVLQDGRPRTLWLGDTAIDELDRVNLQRLGLRAMLLLPLIVHDRIIGMVEVGQREHDQSFTASQIQLAQTLTNQAAIALANAELFAETRRRVAELQTINTVGQAITATMPLTELVNLIRREVGRVLDVSSFYIGLYDAALDHIWFPVFYHHARPTAIDPIPAHAGISGYIVRTRRPLLVNTPGDLEQLGIHPVGDESQSYVGAPMMIGDLAIGVMAVQDYARPYAYDEGHVRILSTIAAQAAIAIENARLFEETQRRLREQGLLYEAGRAISASLEYSAVLETAADQMLRVVEVQGVIFFEWDRDLDRLTTAYSRYVADEGLVTPSAPGMTYSLAGFPHTRQALQQRETSLIHTGDPSLAPGERAFLADTGFVFALTVPMIARDEVIGLVQLADARSNYVFTEGELRLVATLANQIAGAVTNARLYDEVRRFTQDLEARVRQRTDELSRERDRVETLFRITSELSASLDLDRVLNRALVLVSQAVGTSRASILLVDPQADRLIHRAALGRDLALPPGGQLTHLKRDEGLAGWVIRSRLPVIVPDVRKDERWKEQPEHPEHPYRSALTVPLVAEGDALGALMLLHPEVGFFDETQLRLVEAAATQVAVAIGNAALYSYIRENAERLGSMLRDKQVEAAKATAILESVTDGVLVADAMGRIILFNAAAERILGIPRQTVINRMTDDMVGLYESVRRQWEAQVRQWRNEPLSRRMVPLLMHRMEFKDERRFVNVSIAPVTGPGEEFLGTVSVFRDITAEVKADLAKTEFVSTVSHELRTPMTSIKGYADLLLMGAAGSLNENQERFLGIIKSNADRLSVLVNDLLDISRIETGRIELDIRPVAIRPVIEQVIATLRERIEQKNLVVELELPAADSAAANVWGDRARLIQILTNLIGNAYQYTPPNGRIAVRAYPVDDDMLRIDVQDTGIGIAEEDLPKVFDRFFRAEDPMVQEIPGTGLGLSIVQSLVQMHGGRIWVDSTPGTGTTFSFSLPVVELKPDAAEFLPPDEISAVPRVTRIRAGEAEPRVPRILIVEDDADIAALIARNLSQVGYDVKTVGTGQAAIETARQEPFDLITLDIYLPDIDGLKVLNTLKTDPLTSDVPVVVVSVMPDSRESFRMGAIDFLAKPIDSSVLIRAVSKVLGQVGCVLVVEDDADTSRLLAEALQRSGFRVLVTGNGRRALALAKDEQPDLILLDLKLPRMDGYTVLQNLRKTSATANTPVIIMTGSITLDEAKRRQFRALGAANFLTKPFEMKALMAEIDAVLAASHEAGKRGPARPSAGA